jgi:pilus assembly protein CpaB
MNWKESLSPRKRGRPERLRPWRHGQLVYVLLAAVVLLAFIAATRVSSPTIPQVQIVSEEDTITVPTPQRQVVRGEQLSRVEFILVRWPKSKLPAHYLLELEKYRGHFALNTLPPHLPIPLNAISNAVPDSNAVAEAIPQGMRAITVKVDAESAIEGWARRGNYIDVILIRTSKDESPGLESLVIAENVRILSAGASAQPVTAGDTAPKAPNTLTLLVSQEDALRVKIASNVGRLTFALRGNGDSSPTATTSIDQRKLLGQVPTNPKVASFVGRAKGPDGKTYVLSQNSKWFRSSDTDLRSSLYE